MDLKRILAELQRRHVGKVAGVYAVAAWVIIQVVATVFPLMGLSDTIAKVVVVLVALGFPLAIGLAWVFDVTPRGLERTEALPEGAPIAIKPVRAVGRNVGLFGLGIFVALVAFAALSKVRNEHTEKTAAGIRSIAVLPFVDMSEQQNQTYFADGISEELLNRLSQISDLHVPARTASFSFRGSALDINDIGRRLDVEAVLEGSVRREGNNVRVTARLVDARTQRKLWSDEYEKTLSSTFAIQDEIATDIVNALKLQINPEPSAAVGEDAEIDAEPAAVEAYMKGLQSLNLRTNVALRNAVGFFEHAVKEDPDFALGYAMLAQTYAVLPAHSDFPAFEAASKGQAAAARALELNPSLAEAYAALGQIRQNFEWDFESAERSYKRAILFNSGYATAHQWRGEALLLMGNIAEAEAEIQNALDLNPVSAPAMMVRAYAHVARNEMAPASRILDRLLSANPNYPLALVNKAAASIAMKQPVPAQVVASLSKENSLLGPAITAVSEAASNPARKAAAVSALQKLEGRRQTSELALWYALAGANDQALAELQTAYKSGADANLPFVLLHPAFESIRSDKEFQRILRELQMATE